MFNKKNDPLVESVKAVMKQNEVHRQAEAALNEELGISSKRALPHEYHAQYDALLEAKVKHADKSMAKSIPSIVRDAMYKLTGNKGGASPKAPKAKEDPYKEQLRRRKDHYTLEEKVKITKAKIAALRFPTDKITSSDLEGLRADEHRAGKKMNEWNSVFNIVRAAVAGKSAATGAATGAGRSAATGAATGAAKGGGAVPPVPPTGGVPPAAAPGAGRALVPYKPPGLPAVVPSTPSSTALVPLRAPSAPSTSGVGAATGAGKGPAVVGTGTLLSKVPGHIEVDPVETQAGGTAPAGGNEDPAEGGNKPAATPAAPAAPAAPRQARQAPVAKPDKPADDSTWAQRVTTAERGGRSFTSKGPEERNPFASISESVIAEIRENLEANLMAIHESGDDELFENYVNSLTEEELEILGLNESDPPPATPAAAVAQRNKPGPAGGSAADQFYASVAANKAAAAAQDSATGGNDEAAAKAAAANKAAAAAQDSATGGNIEAAAKASAATPRPATPRPAPTAQARPQASTAAPERSPFGDNTSGGNLSSGGRDAGYRTPPSVAAAQARGAARTAARTAPAASGGRNPFTMSEQVKPNDNRSLQIKESLESFVRNRFLKG